MLTFLGETFVVPAMNPYSVKNVQNKRGEISFTVIQERSPRARTDGEVDRQSSINLANASLFSANATSRDSP